MVLKATEKYIPPVYPKNVVDADLIDDLTLGVEPIDRVLDTDWVKQSFLLNDFKYDPSTKPTFKDGSENSAFDANINAINRFYTTANDKFVDSRLGGSIGVNARPQFTRYADIRVPGRLAGRLPRVHVQMGYGDGGNSIPAYGPGRYWSEAIDDHSQTIYIRFGVPQFNSLSNYISAAYDPDLASLARTGVGKSIFYTALTVIGAVVTLTAVPVLSFAFLTSKLLMTFFRTPNSKFYTLKPTMHLYWGAVNTLVNTIAINAGLFPPFLMNDDPNSPAQRIGTDYQVDKATLQRLHDMMPDIFTDGNGFDIFAMATRAQRISNKLAKDEYENGANNTSQTDWYGYVKKTYQDKVEDPLTTHNGLQGKVNAVSNEITVTGLCSWLATYINKAEGFFIHDDPKDALDQSKIFTTKEQKDVQGNTVMDSNGKPVMEEAIDSSPSSWWKEFTESIDAEMKQGSEFAIFKVDYTGPASESIGSATTESEIAQKLNTISSGNRASRFNVQDGNLDDGIIGKAIGAVTSAVGDAAEGTLNGLTFGTTGALAALAGNGFFDIPKYVQSTTTQLNNTSYTMQLISPYANIISQMQNIYIPLAMILAGALPLSTGKFTYTSPFICQLFDRGRCQIKCGVIKSVSITRGTSNRSFTQKGKALAIDVTFSIEDLSSIVHMPLNTGAIFGSGASMTSSDPDNMLMDYLAVLASQDIYSQVYMVPRAKINLALKYSQIRSLLSPANAASFVNDNIQSGLLSYFFPLSWPYKLVSAIDAGNAGVSTSKNSF